MSTAPVGQQGLADDLLASSAESWREDRRGTDEIPAVLHNDTSQPLHRRVRGWRHRRDLREQRAQDFFAASRNPERGLPVAPDRDVVDFIRGMLGRRTQLAVWLVVTVVGAVLEGLFWLAVVGLLLFAGTAVLGWSKRDTRV